jgi:hypothetical protein
MAPDTLSPAVFVPDDDVHPKQEQVLSNSGLPTLLYK